MVNPGVPLDLILDILVWLPAKSVLRFRCVCKEWYNLINTPLFAKLQLNKSLQPDSRHNRILVCNAVFSISIVDDLYHPLKWIKLNWPMEAVRQSDDFKHHVGSCNGLIVFKVCRMNNNGKFMSDYTIRCFLVCNPTTRTFKSILPPSEREWTNLFLSHGFGYDIEHDDYKIVATSNFLSENDTPVCIYSLKTDLWSWSKPPMATDIPTERRWTIRSEAIFANNMLHYLVSPSREVSISDYKIDRFDVVSEKWRDGLSLPVQVNGYVYFGKSLDRWLYLHVVDFNLGSSNVWLMEEYGSWKKMFHLTPRVVYPHCQIIACVKDECHRLLLHYLCDDGTNELFWYDQRDNTRKVLKLKKLPREGQSFDLCIASLVAIPGCSLTKFQQVEDGA